MRYWLKMEQHHLLAPLYCIVADAMGHEILSIMCFYKLALEIIFEVTTLAWNCRGTIGAGGGFEAHSIDSCTLRTTWPLTGETGGLASLQILILSALHRGQKTHAPT